MATGTEAPVSPHSLRRTLAGVLAETVSIHAARYYLGHVEVKTTFRYINPSEKDEEQLAAAIDAYYGELLRETGWT